MNKILITGGTGSLGQALVARYKDRYDLTVLSRNPHRQQQLQEQFDLPPSVFVLADVCDYEAVYQACLGKDILIHAAALKVVSLGEQFPSEYYRVNAVGSQVVARAWAATNHTEDSYGKPHIPRRALYINSDKSVSPINTYGCSKRCGEAAFISLGFSSIRYGNVVESQGSFIHKWGEALKKGNPIQVRNPNPTRFFLSIAEAMDLIDDALLTMESQNGVFVPHSLPRFDIHAVATAITDAVNICNAPLQPGEKQHEILIQEGEVTKMVSDKLAIVSPGRTSESVAMYNSQTAFRMTGQEVLDRLGIKSERETA